MDLGTGLLCPLGLCFLKRGAWTLQLTMLLLALGCWIILGLPGVPPELGAEGANMNEPQFPRNTPAPLSAISIKAAFFTYLSNYGFGGF